MKTILLCSDAVFFLSEICWYYVNIIVTIINGLNHNSKPRGFKIQNKLSVLLIHPNIPEIHKKLISSLCMWIWWHWTCEHTSICLHQIQISTFIVWKHQIWFFSGIKAIFMKYKMRSKFRRRIEQDFHDSWDI